jgi:hypothetical protein
MHPSKILIKFSSIHKSWLKASVVKIDETNNNRIGIYFIALS